MKIRLITLAVVTAGIAASNAMASETSTGVRFSYAIGEPVETSAVQLLDEDGTLIETRVRKVGQPAHSSVKFWSNTDWRVAESILSVELENFENNGFDRVSTTILGEGSEGGDLTTVEHNSVNYASTNVNWQLRSDLEELTGLDVSQGPVSKVYMSTKVNWVAGYAERKRWWVGPTVVFDVPGTTGLELSAWYRDTLNVPGNAWHYIAAYNAPFDIMGQRLSFGQTYEWIEGGERSDSHDWLETETSLTWHIAKDISISALYNWHEDMESSRGYDYHQFAMNYLF